MMEPAVLPPVQPVPMPDIKSYYDGLKQKMFKGTYKQRFKIKDLKPEGEEKYWDMILVDNTSIY